MSSKHAHLCNSQPASEQPARESSCLQRAHILVANCCGQPKCLTRLDTKYIQTSQEKVAMHSMPPSTQKHFLVGRLRMACSMALESAPMPAHFLLHMPATFNTDQATSTRRQGGAHKPCSRDMSRQQLQRRPTRAVNNVNNAVSNCKCSDMSMESLNRRMMHEQ